MLTGNTRWMFGKLRYEWMNRIVTSTNDDGVNWQYMRLADVYLMAAEAENELGNTSAAWSYMKPVLDRALPAAKVAALQAKYTANQTAFRQGIYEQRALEFAGEALRKHDLVRWGIIDQKMDEAKTKLKALATRTGAYEGLPDKVFLYPSEDANDIRVYGLNKGENDADYINTPHSRRLGVEELVRGLKWFQCPDRRHHRWSLCRDAQHPLRMAHLEVLHRCQQQHAQQRWQPRPAVRLMRLNSQYNYVNTEL